MESLGRLLGPGLCVCETNTSKTQNSTTETTQSPTGTLPPLGPRDTPEYISTQDGESPVPRRPAEVPRPDKGPTSRAEESPGAPVAPLAVEVAWVGAEGPVAKEAEVSIRRKKCNTNTTNLHTSHQDIIQMHVYINISFLPIEFLIHISRIKLNLTIIGL